MSNKAGVSTPAWYCRDFGFVVGREKEKGPRRMKKTE
jgi:hypothetical protein